MKKYRRLFIAIITIFCALGFLIYRTEYYKLRSVFELGLLFGSDEFGKDCLVLNKTVEDDTKYNNLFSRPSHQWTKIDDFFVYSAFWRDLDGKQKAVSLGISSEDKDFSKYDCHVWYHLRGSLFSVSGTLTTSSKRPKDIEIFIHEFLCEVEEETIKGKPYMFVFINKQQGTKSFIPIYYKSVTDKANNAAVCVFPDITGLERSGIIEFISYHKLVGFNDVIIYDSGMQHGIISILENVFLNVDFLRSFSVLNWQFPYDNIEAQEAFIKQDCFYRAFNQVELVTFLHWDEYILPRKGKNMLSLFNHHGVSVVFNLETQRCCTELKNDKRANESWPVLLKKTLCIKHQPPRNVILNPNAFSDQYIENVSTSLAVVNSYETCDLSKETKVVRDTTALKFIADLMSNELLRLSRSGIFIDDK